MDDDEVESVAVHDAGAGWLSDVAWNGDGLVPAIVQESATNDVLMFAFMNREALELTLSSGHAVFWSRSRKRLWHKGEESGHVQKVEEIRLDCDGDVVLLRVEQVGDIACHTGRHSCFFSKLEMTPDGIPSWVAVDPVLKSPSEIYHE